MAMCEDWFQDRSVSENKDREPGRATHTDWRLIPTCSLSSEGGPKALRHCSLRSEDTGGVTLCRGRFRRVSSA